MKKAILKSLRHRRREYNYWFRKKYNERENKAKNFIENKKNHENCLIFTFTYDMITIMLLAIAFVDDSGFDGHKLNL